MFITQEINNFQNRITFFLFKGVKKENLQIDVIPDIKEISPLHFKIIPTFFFN